MNFILRSRRLKFYTKEIIKFCKYIIFSILLILIIIFCKYKPVYGVKISGTQIGYIENIQEFEDEIQNNIKEYKAKNIYNVSVKNEPEYELKLVDKTQKTNESDILIAMQEEAIINYRYYDICVDQDKVDSVDTLEEAELIVSELKDKNNEIQLQIVEQITQNIDDVKTNELETAKTNVFNKFNIVEEQKEEEKRSTINGIRLAVVPVKGTITSRYGVSSRIRVSTHTGLDIAANKGTDIKVVADGKVIFAEYSGSYGYLVKIDHGNGVETWYAHTSKMYVKKGDTVKAGDVIAAVGSTGNSTGPHLHFEIRINGKDVDPLDYMKFI